MECAWRPFGGNCLTRLLVGIRGIVVAIESVMSFGAENIRRMVLAHTSGDTSEFRREVEAYIDEQRRLNHPVVARDIERLLRNGSSKPVAERTGERWGTGSLSSFAAAESSALFGDLPLDKERGVPLIEMRTDAHALEDLLLAPDTLGAVTRVIVEHRHHELLASHGLRPSQKMLFCGVPGCGKSAVAGALANAMYMPLALVRFDAVISSYLGDTAANLRKVFEFARTRPVVLFFDEFDAIGKRRMDESEHGELKRVVNSFLQLLDGYRGDSVIVAATNHEQILDPALWRRFDEIVAFPKPTAAQIEQLLSRRLRQVGVASGVQLGEQAKALVGLSFADVERIATDAVKSVVIDGDANVGTAGFRAAAARQLLRVQITSGSTKKQARGVAARRVEKRKGSQRAVRTKR